MEHTMENNTVPYIVYESAMARMERTIKRLWILAIILIALLFSTNAAWIYHESQWQVENTTIHQKVTQETDGGGNNQFIGGDYHGETNSANDKDH